MKYRYLRTGEKIKEGDELFSLDRRDWNSLSDRYCLARDLIGDKVLRFCGTHRLFRRPLKSKKGNKK